MKNSNQIQQFHNEEFGSLDILMKKLIRAANEFGIREVAIAGGVNLLLAPFPYTRSSYSPSASGAIKL